MDNCSERDQNNGCDRFPGKGANPKSTRDGERGAGRRRLPPEVTEEPRVDPSGNAQHQGDGITESGGTWEELLKSNQPFVAPGICPALFEQDQW